MKGSVEQGEGLSLACCIIITIVTTSKSEDGGWRRMGRIGDVRIAWKVRGL